MIIVRCQISNFYNGTFDSVDGIWIFFWSNSFIWSAMDVPLSNLFHNVSLSKKWIFLNWHPCSISILFSKCSSKMLASFKSKIENFASAIFLHFRRVWTASLIICTMYFNVHEFCGLFSFCELMYFYFFQFHASQE